MHRMETKESARKLVFFPIIHSRSEMGSLEQPVLSRARKEFDPRQWRTKTEFVKWFWVHVEHVVFNELSLHFERTRVYQDGLPICDKVEDIVAEMAMTDSPNFKILLRLKQLGATIMGTESPLLLVEEYQRAKLILKDFDASSPSGGSTTPRKNREASDLLLKERDVCIAARIDQTLQRGETGILFLGMLHNPIAFLPADIHVLYPIGKPLSG